MHIDEYWHSPITDDPFDITRAERIQPQSPGREELLTKRDRTMHIIPKSPPAASDEVYGRRVALKSIENLVRRYPSASDAKGG